jgi:hypothetical protein
VPYARPYRAFLTLAAWLLAAGPLGCANRGMQAPGNDLGAGGSGGSSPITDASMDALGTGGGKGGAVGTGGGAGGMNSGGSGGSGTGGVGGRGGGAGGSSIGGGAGKASTGGTGGTGTGGTGTGGTGTGGMGTGGVGTGGMGTGGSGTGGTGTGGTGTGGTGTGGMGTGGSGTGGTGTGGTGTGGTGTGGTGTGGVATGGNGGAGGMSNGGAGGQALPSMFAYYPFDQTAGPTITDASGNGRNGTLLGTATFPAGVIGNGLTLPGATGDNVTLPSAFIQTLTNITITVWVNVHADQTWQRVFDFGSSQNVYMFLTSHAGGANARFAITTAGNTMEQVLNGTAVLPVGTWTHVAIVLGSNGGTLYINGAPVATNTALTLRPADLGATANNYLGRSQFADPYFNGEIDDFRIYASALTAAQITTIYSAR